MALNTQPNERVLVCVVSDDPPLVNVNPDEMSFGPDNWATPQTIAVLAPDDGEVGAAHTAQLTFAVVAGESDPAFMLFEDKWVLARLLSPRIIPSLARYLTSPSLPLLFGLLLASLSSPSTSTLRPLAPTGM